MGPAWAHNPAGAPSGASQACTGPGWASPAWPRPGPGLNRPILGLLRPIWGYKGCTRAIIRAIWACTGLYRPWEAYIEPGQAWPGPCIHGWPKGGYKHIPATGTLGPARIGLRWAILGLPALAQPVGACIRPPEGLWLATRALQGQ